jgi:hypothetical protein
MDCVMQLAGQASPVWWRDADDARNGANGQHRATPLRKSRKSANIHTKSGFNWEILDHIPFVLN